MRLPKKEKRVLMLLVIMIMLFSSWNYPQEGEEQKIKKYFKMSLQELLNIEITTAGKKVEKIADVPASIVIITREDIELYGYQSLPEILENVPGLYPINSRDFFGESFGVRGYWSGFPENIIYMINGVDQGDAKELYRFQNFSIPVEAIERIEIVRGPMSVIYGNGAFFGAVNIITNETPDEKAVSLISGSIGSEKTKKAAVRAATHQGQLKFSFNAGFSDTYGPDEPLSKMVSDMSTLAVYGISEENNNTTTGGRLEFDSSYFNFSGTYKGFFADISYNQSAREEYHFWPSFSDGLLCRDHFSTISFGYEAELSDKATIKGIFKYYNFAYWREFDAFWPDFFGTEYNRMNKYELEVNALFKPSRNFDFIVGLNYKEKDVQDKLDVPILSLNIAYYASGIKTYAFFTQANYKLSKKLKFVAGARLENMPKYSLRYSNNSPLTGFILTGEYEMKKIELVPRIALIYNLNDKNILKLLYGKAVKFPDYFTNVNQMVSGYEYIEPEYINTIEINYLATLSSKFSANLSVFRNHLFNLPATFLRFDDQGNWAPYTTNAGKMVSIGAELLVYAKPFQGSFFELGGTWQKTEDKRPGFEDIIVEYSPNWLGYIKASYHFTNDISLAVTGRYVDEMETHWDVAKINPDGTLGGRIAQKVDGYFILDANLRFRNLFGKGFYLNIRCSNIFDTGYLYPQFNTNKSWADKGVFGNPRTLLVTIGKKF